MAHNVLAHPPPRFDDNSYTGRWSRALRDAGLNVEGLTIKSLFRHRHAIVHIHWPEHLISHTSSLRRCAKTANTLVMLAILSAARRTVFLTAHNAKPHEIEIKGFQKLVLAWVHRLASGVVITAPRHERLMSDLYPRLGGVPFHIIPLGSMALERPIRNEPANSWPIADNGSSRPARFVQFGAISPYKQQDRTLDALESSIRSGVATLVIVGRVLDSAFAKQIRARVEGLDGAVIIDRHVSDDELADLISSADASLALQRGALNSGVIPASVPLGTPVVSADTMQARACEDALGEQWIRCVTERLDDADWERIAAWAREPRDRTPPVNFDWDRNVALHLAAYGSVAEAAAVVS